MTWLIIGLGVLILGIAIYYSIPFFKKLAKKRDNVKSSQRSTERAIRREEKKANRENKRKEKAKKVQKQKEEGLVTDAADLDNEHAIDLINEDPDEKVNLENLSYENYFDNEPIQTEHKTVERVAENPLEEDIGELFEKMFNVNSNRPVQENQTDFISDGSLDGNEEDIKDFLEEFDMLNSEGRGTLADDFNKLSPEMKALFISNLFDKKY